MTSYGRKKKHYISKGNLTKPFEEGGLQAIDFECLNSTLKLNWLKSFIKHQHKLWFLFPNYLFSKIGGIDFLLCCDFDVRKIPIQLSPFHQQILMYWKMIYKHNFSPHNTPVWNCRYITFRNKSLFNKNLIENDIWSVTHFLKDNNTFMSHNEFTTKYKVNISSNEYKNIINAIPTAFCVAIGGCTNYTDCDSLQIQRLWINGKEIY